MKNLEKFINERYNFDKNYKILINSNSKICFVFCSSNGLYATLNEKKVEDYFSLDYYEWENVTRNKKISKEVGKIIFVRDPFAKSYVNGINKDINTIDKIIEFLASETNGYDTTIIGYSAGGYLSIILGSKLSNVKRVYSFGGLFSLYKFTGLYNDIKFEDIKEYTTKLGNDIYEKWFDIKEVIRTYDKELIHFYGSMNSADLVQMSEISDIKNRCIHYIGIKTKRHGGEFYGMVYPYIFTVKDKKLDRLLKKAGIKNLGKFELSINVIPLPIFFFLICRKKIIGIFKKRII